MPQPLDHRDSAMRAIEHAIEARGSMGAARDALQDVIAQLDAGALRDRLEELTRELNEGRDALYTWVRTAAAVRPMLARHSERGPN